MRRTTSRRSVLAGCAAIAATLVGVGARADPAASTDGFYLVVSGAGETSRAVELPDRYGGSEWVVAPPLMSFAEVAGVETAASDYGSPLVVLITLTPAGAAQFGAMTKRHIRERLAIVLGGVIVVAPVILEPIMGGEIRIDGGFQAQEAEELAAQIRSNIPI